jgi:acyl-CoA synthetase (AMP-forming)/AMP-acid ligase II
MTATRLTYFTCTLGQAAVWNKEHPHAFETVNRLIDEQAEKFPDTPAVNFPNIGHEPDNPQAKSGFTFQELQQHTIASARKFHEELQNCKCDESPVVGLLCTSTPEFLLAWLGLMRLGKSVLLLA